MLKLMTYFFSTLITLLMLTVPGTVKAQCPGLANNGDMEGGVDPGNGLPNGYYFYFDGAGTGSGGVTTDTPDGSATAAELTAAGGGFAGYAQYIGGITAGQSYTFSADVKVSSPTGTANIYVSWRDGGANGGAEVGTAFSANATAGDGYVALSVDAVAPAGAVNVQMAINFVEATVRTDNFCVEAAAPPTVEGCDGNLLTNGTLDINLDGWFTYSAGADPTTYAATGGENGTGAAEVGPANQAFYGFGQSQAATVGEGYLARVAAKQTGIGNIQLILKFKDAGGGDIGAAQTADIVSPNFQVYEVGGQAPAGTVGIEVLVGGSNGGGATVDNLCLLSGYDFSTAGACPDNLATDFGFENGTEWFGDSGWGCYGANCSGSNIKNAGDPASGLKAVRVEGASPGNPDGDGYNGLAYFFTAVAGAEYTFTADLKRLGTSYYGAMHVYWQNAAGGDISGEQTSVNNGGVYESYNLTAVAPANTTQAVLVFETGNTGFLLVDNVCISEDISLPVSLLNFSGQPLAKSNRLTWVTAREEQTAAFYLERQAANGNEWTIVSEVAAAGFSQENRTYSTEDPNPPLNGLYRLRTMDTDGSEQLSATIQLKREMEGRTLRAYPNPFQSSITVATRLETAGTYRLLDVLGRVMSEGPVAAGDQRTVVSTAELPRGRYFLKIGEQTLSLIK